LPLLLPQEVNTIYHQLIELQEQEDRTRAEMSGILAHMREMRELIRERETGIPYAQLKVYAHIRRFMVAVTLIFEILKKKQQHILDL
jgi:hypothetical protein